MPKIRILLAIFAMLLGQSDQVSPKKHMSPQAKLSLSEAIELMQPSVVQIAARVELAPAAPGPGQFPFPARPIIANLGSGFIVTSDGHVVTARHVVHAFETLQIPPGARKTLIVGLALPNLENYKSGGATISIRASFVLADCRVLDEDARHDIALLKYDPAAQTTAIISAPGGPIGPPHHAAMLSQSIRPRDGERIAVSGYPLSQTVLITTSGNLASSWAIEEQQKQVPGAPPGFTMPDVADVYIGDMRVNPGNSGGPVYSVDDGKVIGVCVAYDLAPVAFSGDSSPVIVDNRQIFSNSGLSVIVPIQYVLDLLRKHSLKWTS